MLENLLKDVRKCGRLMNRDVTMCFEDFHPCSQSVEIVRVISSLDELIGKLMSSLESIIGLRKKANDSNLSKEMNISDCNSGDSLISVRNSELPLESVLLDQNLDLVTPLSPFKFESVVCSDSILKGNYDLFFSSSDEDSVKVSEYSDPSSPFHYSFPYSLDDSAATSSIAGVCESSSDTGLISGDSLVSSISAYSSSGTSCYHPVSVSSATALSSLPLELVSFPLPEQYSISNVSASSMGEVDSFLPLFSLSSDSSPSKHAVSSISSSCLVSSSKFPPDDSELSIILPTPFPDYGDGGKEK
jgi:hypothetical protein